MDALQLLGIVLLVIGISLLCIEIYIPGFGLPGISGIICAITGIGMAAKSLNQLVFLSAVSILIILGMMLVSIHLLKSSHFHSPIRLDTEIQGKEQFRNHSKEALEGRTGIAKTDLRPSGKGDFDGTVLDVLSNGEFIKKGTRIQITKILNNQVLVKEEPA